MSGLIWDSVRTLHATLGRSVGTSTSKKVPYPSSRNPRARAG